MLVSLLAHDRNICEDVGVKIFLSPSIALHSRAMVRIANALTTYVPSSVTITPDISSADLVILYPISHEWFKLIDQCKERGQEYALVQCCYKTAGGSKEEWQDRWNEARITWSYLNLPWGGCYGHSYYAPLGADPTFCDHFLSLTNREYVITTGYVHGRPAEAIMEVWVAAERVGLPVIHVGGWPQNVLPRLWYKHIRQIEGVSDDYLARIYRKAKYVVSLRYVEGFELPAAEGLCCGARPILFDQPDLRQWYGDHAIYLPEIEGDELVDRLEGTFRNEVHGDRVSEEERNEAVRLFDWKTIVEGFWKEVLR